MNASAHLHTVPTAGPAMMICRHCKGALTEGTRHPNRRKGRIHKECALAEARAYNKRYNARKKVARPSRQSDYNSRVTTVAVSRACARRIKREAERRGVAMGEVIEQALDCSRKPGLLARIFG